MIVGPRYNDVDPAVEAAYEREAEAETATSKLDSIAARLEARRALPCEVCDDGEECACCAVDREFAEVVAVVREVAAVLETILDVATDGVMVEDDSTETDLQTAQKRGGALDRIQDLVMNAQDRLEETDRG